MSPPDQAPALTTVEWVQPFERTSSGTGLGSEFNLVIAVQGYSNSFSADEAVVFAKEFLKGR